MTAALVLLSVVSLEPQSPLSGSLRVDLTSNTRLFEQAIGAGFELRVRRENDAHGHHVGWWVSVVRAGGTEDMLRPRAPRHGLTLTDFYASDYASRTGPYERHLWLSNPPTQVDIRISDYETTGSGDEKAFTADTVRVDVRTQGASIGDVIDTQKYALDGKSHTFERGVQLDHPGRRGGRVVQWDPREAGFIVLSQYGPISERETWRLSNDGDMLTIETIGGEPGTRPRRVFLREY